MLLKLYCNLRVIPIAFATKHGSLAVLRMPNPRTLPESGGPARRFNLQPGPRNLLSPCRKETRDVIHRLTGCRCFAGKSCLGTSAQPRSLRRTPLTTLGGLIFVLVAVVALPLVGIRAAVSVGFRIWRRIGPTVAGAIL